MTCATFCGGSDCSSGSTAYPMVSTLISALGEGGHRLFEGERRRISVARALLADFPAIVFDEPTANLDQSSVDEIIVLEAGAVAERGRHGQLVNAGGPYARSWESEHSRSAF